MTTAFAFLGILLISMVVALLAALQLVIPALVAVLVHWGLVRRRQLRTIGEDDLSRWPWVTTAVAGLVLLNPFGLAFLQATLRHSASDLLWDFMATITAAVLGVL